MKAYTYTKAHDIKNFAIEASETDSPVPGPLDIIVRIRAISFNPVDTKIRQARNAEEGQKAVIGWDASGIVEETGSEVQGFKKGDEVYYAGDLNRPGTYGELQAVDYRLVAKKPSSMSFTEAAALPLTSLTAWEALFDRGFTFTKETKVLIIGGAGGVGSMATQLLQAHTEATVITTASRPETKEWCRKMGAHYIIGRDIKSELKKIGVDSVDLVFGTTHTGEYLETIRDILKPFGNLVLIDDPKNLDIVSFKAKALSVHWEFMFARSMFNHNPEQQGEVLKRVAELADKNKIISTLNLTLKDSAASIQKAHELLESGASIGKIVMERL